MGDVIKFAGKKPEKPTEPESEDVAAVMCGHCTNVTFFLAVDGRLFCVECRGQVDAFWCLHENEPVA